MPPKTIFNREDVINAAFELAKKSGFRDFTARRIAEELSSSTAPVYSCFKSMDELREEVLINAEKVALEYMMKTYTSSVFLNMGTGFVLFAQENRELFRILILESPETRELLTDFMKSLYSELYRDELISRLPEKQKKEVLRRMAVFSHGLASLICVGFHQDVSKNEAISIMYNMGKDIIDIAFMKAGIKKDITAEPEGSADKE